MKTIVHNNRFQRLAVFALLIVCGSALWAGGKKQIETVIAEGGEIWDNDFDVTGRKKGIFNFIVYARDRAGNEAVSGAFNVTVDPNADLPIARFVYPENNTVIRQNVNVLGFASGRYGVSNVFARLDDGEIIQVAGLEYWSQTFDLSDAADGKHSLYVFALDSKGVEGPEQKIDFLLDKTPPRIDLISHNIGDIITGTTTFKGEASDPNGIMSIAYSEDGIKFTSLPVKNKKRELITTQSFSMSINTKKYPDGPLVYYVRTVDSTGVATVNPYLFFVTNSVPELEIYTPAPDENVYGSFLLSGRAYDKIGLSALYYEWGKIRESIPIRPGDPYWNIHLNIARDSAATIKVIAIDKVGNSASVTCKLEDRRKVKTPVLVIDYPPEDVLRTMNRGIPPDTAIYGHIAPGIEPLTVMVDGFGEVQALSSFRIAPRMIRSDSKKVQTLKLTPIAADGSRGTPLSLRYLKQNRMMLNESTIDIASPEKNSWLSGSSFVLRGVIITKAESLPDETLSEEALDVTLSGEELDAMLDETITDTLAETLPAVDFSNARVEYRLSPDEEWRTLWPDEEGAFETSVDMADRPHGPVHLEIRTIMDGVENYPLYHPVSRSVDQPVVQIIAPTGDRSLVFGSKTVTAVIEHTVPIRQVAYSLDGEIFTEIPFVTRYGKAWFEYFCNFTDLNDAGGQLVFRVTDAGGALYDVYPEYSVDEDPPRPVIIVNTPVDEEVFPNPFEISGLAYYDVPIYGVYWRLLGPRMGSITLGPAGDYARQEAAHYEANPDMPFEELLTDQNFRIPVDFTRVTDGEYVMEIYAADIYGMRSEKISRTIMISTEPPETEVVWPVITRYNRKAITVKGYTSDANDVARVSLSMDNGNTWQKVKLSADGNWELSLNTTAFKDGIYSALIRAEDKYGIVAYSNAMVNIDNTAPELYLASPKDGQYVGTEMPLMGRLADNITVKSLSYQIINVLNPETQKLIEAEPSRVLFDTVNFEDFPQGEYILRIVATDLADNETLVSRKIVYDANDKAAEISIYNPLPGEVHSGTVHVAGIVRGSFLPPEVRLTVNEVFLDNVPVDRYGIFHYDLPEKLFMEEEEGEAAEDVVADDVAAEEKPEIEYRITAAYTAATGDEIVSMEHNVYYSPYGPVLHIESHQDGDVITARPWLSGRAWIAFPDPVAEEIPAEEEEFAEGEFFEEEIPEFAGEEFPELAEEELIGEELAEEEPAVEGAPRLSRAERARRKKESLLRDVMVSHDNGRTFESVRGDVEWRVRLETSELPPGPQPVLIRAVFANGQEAVRRLIVNVDTTLPLVETLSPMEKTRHRDELAVYGTAGDNLDLVSVDISLRPDHKIFYSVPPALRGMYFDLKGFGATYFDQGVGLSLFNDNVRLQVQYGLAPKIETRTNIPGTGQPVVWGGRYVGSVFGVKLLANIFHLPFAYFFGLDWAFYSMNIAVGANFSWFTMDDWRTPLFMGAIVAQWDVANINMQYFYPQWKYFRNFAIYVEPELWFASSDVSAEVIPRITFGVRYNWF